MPIPVNTLLTAEQYGYLFADSRAAGAVIAAPMLDMLLAIRPRLPHLRAIVVVGAPDGEPLAPGVHRFEDVLTRAEPSPCAQTMSDEVAFWMYTSGSTGDPKAVRHVHTSLMAVARLMGQGASASARTTWHSRPRSSPSPTGSATP